MNKNKRSSDNSLQEKQKIAVLEQLKKTPIIKVACERAGVSRTSFYRWQEEDQEFSKAVDLSVVEGKLTLNDMSEFQLLSLVHEKHPSAIRYWLENHHPDYMKKGRAEERSDPGPSVIMLHDHED